MKIFDKLKAKFHSSKEKGKKKNNIFNKIKKVWKKKIYNKNNKFEVREVVFLMLITFLFGMIIGGVVMFGRGTFASDISDSLNEFVDTYEDILDSYYEDVDANELMQAGIEGMIEYLGDPYAAFMDSEEAQAFNEQVEGEYSGIGAEIGYNFSTGIFKIGTVFEDSPAEKAGLKTDDVLLKVNNEDIKGKSTSEIASIVKGKTGTKVTLTVMRDKEELEIVIKRGNVDISSVETKMFKEKEKNIGYIAISIFANNTYKQFKEKLMELEKEGIDELIIDVRSNSGGYLTSVTDIISMFTEKGSVIYQLSTKGDIEKVEDKTKEKREYPIHVLANEGSASASEVLTAALKENYGATVFGTKTYGKGKVQKAYNLLNGAKIKYTFQEWLTPNGNSIDGIGVEPNIIVDYKLTTDQSDNQLDEVIKYISK